MPWLSESVSNRFRRNYLVITLSVLLCGSIAGSAGAIGTEIGAVVCGTGTPGAAISITQPNDDSIVNQATTTFRGTINNTSQLEIEIDGSYVSTVAVGSNQALFSTDISLSEGTHTIKLTANDICGGQDADDSVVITYTPLVNEPSSGGSTPTEVDGQSTVDQLNQETIPDDETEHLFIKEMEELPVTRAIVGLIDKFADSIGLSGTLASTNAIAGVARVGMTIVGLTSVIMASAIASAAASAIPGLSEVFNISSSRSMMYLSWIIRASGILMMAIVYFL